MSETPKSDPLSARLDQIEQAERLLKQYDTDGWYSKQLVESLRDLLTELRRLQQDRQLIADVLEERADELSKEACDRCEDCGALAMCRFHSVLSALTRNTWTQPAIDRDNLKRRLQQIRAYAQHKPGCWLSDSRDAQLYEIEHGKQPDCTCGLSALGSDGISQETGKAE